MDGGVSFKALNNNCRAEEERLKTEGLLGAQGVGGKGELHLLGFLREGQCQGLQPGFKNVITELWLWGAENGMEWFLFYLPFMTLARIITMCMTFIDRLPDTALKFYMYLKSKQQQPQIYVCVCVKIV